MVSIWLYFKELLIWSIYSNNILIIIVACFLHFDSIYLGNDFIVIVIDFVFGFRS